MLWEKEWPKRLLFLNLFFVWLGWPWVGESVCLITIFVCFPILQNLVNRKHGNRTNYSYLESDVKSSVRSL